MSTLSGAIKTTAEHELGYVDCAVIVVTYNSARHIGSLLDSLPAAADGLRLRCLVVDNDSRDGTADIVRHRGGVTLIEPGENLGYAGAINVGRAHAGPTSSILILNPDVELEPGAITRLHDALGQPGVGVAVPRLLNEDGSLFFTLRREPSPTRALGDALLGSRFRHRPGWLSETIRDRDTYERPTDVVWAGGAVMMISAKCHRAVGSWDEDFFLYSEETDFAARVRRAGYRVRYVPDARVAHEDGGSGRSPALNALLAVNRIRYYEKYHRGPATWVFRFAVAFGHALRFRAPAERAALRAVCLPSARAQLPGRASASA